MQGPPPYSLATSPNYPPPTQLPHSLPPPPQPPPVDGAAVDERRELAQPLPEGAADGAEAQHHVQVLRTLGDRGGERERERVIERGLRHQVRVLRAAGAAGK